MFQHNGRSNLLLIRFTERQRETFYGFGGNVGRVTPDPIPNSEVKPVRADGTAGEALWESRTLPELWKPASKEAGFLLWAYCL